MSDYYFKIVFVFILLFSSSVMAQQENYKAFGFNPSNVNDSLYIKLELTYNLNEKRKVIEEIANIHIKFGNTDSIIYYGNLLKKSALNNAEGLTDLLWLSKSYTILGKGSTQKGFYDDAMKYYLKGINITPATEKPILYYNHKLGLAFVYIQKKEYEKAITLLEECYKKSNNHKIIAFVKKYYGNIYLSKEDFVQSKKYYKKALLDFNHLKLNKQQLIVQANLGTIAILENDVETAFEYLSEVKNKALKENFYDLYITTVIRIGYIYSSKKQYKDAQMILSTAYVNAVQWNKLELQKKVIKNMITFYVEEEDYKNAYNLMTQYNRVFTKIMNSQKIEVVKELEIKYQTTEKENEIKKQKTTKRAILIGFLIILIPIITLLYVYYQKIQAQSLLQKKQEVINKQKISSLIKKQELKLIKTTVDAQNEEKERIARELHDSVGGNLAAIKLQMNNLTERTTIKQTIINQLEETYQQIREISHNLIPDKFSQNAFTTLISEYIEKLDKSSSQNITFNPYPKEKINKLNEHLQVEVFYILQELLTNAIKHSKAKNVEIYLNIHNKILQILFEDNGVGFDKGNTKKGIGLQNIKNRLLTLKAIINIDATINRGTIIAIEIPINYDTPSQKTNSSR